MVFRSVLRCSQRGWRDFYNPPRIMFDKPRAKRDVPPEFYDLKKTLMEQESNLVIGQVIAHGKNDSVEVRFRRYMLDPIFLAFFPHSKSVFVLDREKQTNNGDIVLVEKIHDIAERPGRDITYKLKETVFKVGRTIDPVTNKRVEGTDFIEHQRRVGELHNPNMEHVIFQDDFPMDKESVQKAAERDALKRRDAYVDDSVQETLPFVRPMKTYNS